MIKIDKILDSPISSADLARGYLRYEFIRKLNPMCFAELYQRNINGEGAFDDLIDAEMAREDAP